MKSIFRRHFGYSEKISDELYNKHKEVFLKRFGDERPTYLQIVEWINDASGIAIFINIVSHMEWNNTRPDSIPSETSLPIFKAFAFHYSELSSAPEEFVDDWEGCADNAIDAALSNLPNQDWWFPGFTEEYDGSCEKYKNIEEYITSQRGISYDTRRNRKNRNS